jgi:hypothetical protein
MEVGDLARMVKGGLEIAKREDMSNTRAHRIAILSAWAGLACACGSDPVGDGDGTTSAGSTGPAPVTTTSDVEPESSASTSPSPSTGLGVDSTSGGSTVTDTGPPFTFDLGIIPESPIVEGPCGKVDFLFIIDNSGSMADKQASLVASFPGFITAIQSTLETVEEYNVGVITTDAYFANTAVPGCAVLGGLVTATGGFDSSNMVCGPYDAGDNFMTQEDDLETAFACAAQVGTQGDGLELPMQALIDATDPEGPLADPGACNEGFLREDALLVLVIITDENDGPTDTEGMPSPGTAMDWYDAVVEHKQGIPENVVVVSLVNAAGGPCPPLDLVYDGVHIVEFTELFEENGLVGGVCEPDYSPFLAQAVEVIDVACENFMPPN